MPAPSYAILHPSFVEPGYVMPYAQASNAFELLGRPGVQVKLGEGDLYVYIRGLDVRTRAAAGQVAYNQLPGPQVTPSWASTPTYLMRARAEWDHHDESAYAKLGINLPEANRLAMRQGHIQLARNLLLYGMNAANGEGLVNAQGGTTINLPADSNGHSTVTTYDPGQMAQFILQTIQAIKTRMFQLGMPREVVIIGPQRVLGQFDYAVVELTSYQRPGAGSQTVRGEIDDILKTQRDTFLWGYDDTLIGKGNGGTDAVIMIIPEIQRPNGNDPWNTNIFATLQPGIDFTVAQYADMAAPREIPTPIAGGKIDLLTEMRMTSGWMIRPEAVTVVSMPFP